MNIQIRIHKFTDIRKQTSYLLFLGYGDISPKTDHGKLFYIGFSVVSIPLMMTLLVSCGDIMSIMNRKIFGLVQRCLFRKYKLVSFKPISRGSGQFFPTPKMHSYNFNLGKVTQKRYHICARNVST